MVENSLSLALLGAPVNASPGRIVAPDGSGSGPRIKPDISLNQVETMRIDNPRLIALTGHALATAGLLWLLVSNAGAADPAFQQWLAGLWPQAQSMGVSRATFDAATRGLEPDLS